MNNVEQAVSCFKQGFYCSQKKGMDSCVINYVYSPIISRLSTKEISCKIKKVFYSDF